MKFVLDTNVISELVAVKPNSEVVAWIDNLDPDQVFLSVIAVGELKKGIEKLIPSKRKDLLNEWLRDELLIRFEGHILPIDTETMLLWGAINARLEGLGRPISAIDSLLAATALQHHCTLVTRNTNHFENTGVLLQNPWQN